MRERAQHLGERVDKVNNAAFARCAAAQLVVKSLLTVKIELAWPKLLELFYLRAAGRMGAEFSCVAGALIVGPRIDTSVRHEFFNVASRGAVKVILRIATLAHGDASGRKTKRVSTLKVHSEDQSH